MSVNSIIDTTSIDPDYKDKIFPDLIPWEHPAGQQGLGSVLQVNSSAFIPNTTTAQDATDFATLGCVKIETGTVGMGNQPALVIGEVGDLLQIKGGTLLGSILAGNGVNTETLPLGTNGYVLTADSSAGVGVKWASAGGAGVASITAGTNIGVNNTIPTAPVVSLLSPLTAELNIGAQSIRDSAGAVGTSGQVLTAGTGAQTLWGTNGVSSITAGTNISITGTASVPIVNLGTLGVLTSTLNAGTQNIQGTSSQFTLTNGGSQANATATLGFTSADASVPTTKSVLFKTGLTCQTATNAVVVSPTSVVKSGTTAFSITSGSSQIVIQGSGGGANGIQLNQLSGQGTTLITNLANVNYYPDFVLTNGDAITQAVPAPQVIHQRLTLNNLGLTNTSLWSDYGGLIWAGYSAFFKDSNNNLWLAEAGTGNIQVCDNPPTTTLYNITMSGTTGVGSTAVNVFYEQGGYVFIGGNFNEINGNAQPQFGIARVEIASSSYTEDPIFDSGNTECGVFNGEVYDMTDVAGELDIVGSFTTTNIGNTALRMLTITDPYVAGGGSQTFIESYGGADNIIYTILYETTVNRVYYGGNFSGVGMNLTPVGCNFIAYWDVALTGWNVVAGNVFDGQVNKIVFTGHTDLYVVGNFNMVPSTYNCYLDVVGTGGASDSNRVLSNPPTFQQAFHFGGNLAVMDGTTFYREDGVGVWTSLGVPEASGTTITGINYDPISSGDWKVIYDNYTHIRSHSILPHSCEFQGSFMYDNTSYTKYTIVPRNVSQQFIGDNTCSFWSIVGAGVGTFS